MDQIKIGKFIAEMRKAQGITQKGLAERLEISDKTVSKWECGNGLPEISLMMPLCEVLEINVNELLSGEKLSEIDYSKKAEENMMSLIQKTEEQERNGRRNIIQILFGILAFGVLVVLMLAYSGPQSVAPGLFLDVPELVVLILMTVLLLAATEQGKDFLGAFRIAYGKKDSVTLVDIKKAQKAVDFCGKVMLWSGVFMTLFYIIVVLHKLSAVESMGGHLGLAVLSTFYGVVAELLLLPVKGRLERKILLCQQEMLKM